ncbi:carboxymuconolactone decarboxylase family protein [Isoptericola sp. 4D.3]|uniref:Carboxymuconolactone decarboxylase family protein n=1 Tax=Isoptericola peretonis TaxID=2918523 RepID=A0ABT0IZY4_9MICO|nr:carboxymuconolactone decarboxylase family protein [Isoptericola sp. 4D.3]
MTTTTSSTSVAPTSAPTHAPTARMANPAGLLPGARDHLVALGQAVRGQGVDDETLELTHLRASQVNGCAWCLDFGLRSARKAGMSDERIVLVAGWREAPCYTRAERAALALAESMTRLADRADAVPDDVWAEAARHYDEQALAALVLWIATTNLYNRLNVTTRQVAGTW